MHPASACVPEILGDLGWTDHEALAVSANEGRTPLLQELQALNRHGPENDVSAREDDLRIYFGEDGFERGQVPVHVVEGRNLHQRVNNATDSTWGVCGNMSRGRTRSSR